MSDQAREYYTVEDYSTGEIVEKKSRFIASVYHVESEKEATDQIERLKKQYWDARHNCYAYILGKNSELMRFSDDGEPSGTAGKPILEVLKGRGLTDTLVVITRYFGGVLLGTGGLVRAYTDSTVAGIEAGNVLHMCLMRKLEIGVDYNTIGKLKYMLANDGIGIVDEQYTDSVIITAVIPIDDADRVVNRITDVTNGKASIEQGDVGYFALTN